MESTLISGSKDFNVILVINIHNKMSAQGTSQHTETIHDILLKHSGEHISPSDMDT